VGETIGSLHDAGGEDEAPDGVVYAVALCQLGPGAPESKLATGDSARDCTPVGDGASGKMRSDSYPTSSGIESPSLTPVPSYTQEELPRTTQGRSANSQPSLITPSSFCSGS